MRPRFLPLVAVVCPVLFSLPLRKSTADPTTRPASTTQPTIPVSVLENTPIIGKLGLPFGTCAEVQATIISGRDTHMKELEGRFSDGIEADSLSFSEGAIVTIGVAKEKAKLVVA